MPEVDLPELLIEVDGWTGLTDHLVPLSGNRRAVGRHAVPALRGDPGGGNESRSLPHRARQRVQPARVAARWFRRARLEFASGETMMWAIVSEVSDAGLAARADHETGF